MANLNIWYIPSQIAHAEKLKRKHLSCDTRSHPLFFSCWVALGRDAWQLCTNIHLKVSSKASPPSHSISDCQGHLPKAAPQEVYVPTRGRKRLVLRVIHWTQVEVGWFPISDGTGEKDRHGRWSKRQGWTGPRKAIERKEAHQVNGSI